MNVKLEVLEKNMSKITVEVPFEQFEKAVNTVYNRQKGKISLPGFRKGHAPKAMIEKVYGSGVFYEDAANIVIDETYPGAVKESGADFVSRPEISVEKIEKGQPFVYSAIAATRPEVTLGQYKGVKVEKADTAVTAKEVDAELKRVQNQNARIISIDDAERKVKKDDTAVIDFEGFVDGTAFEGGKGEDYALEIGSHSFIDTFEDQIIGHRLGDEFDVNVTFPENYQAENLAGKPALFKVKVKEIKEKQLPEINDEFASEVSEFETLKEYKADIKKELKARKEKSAAQTNENNIVDAVIEAASVEIPDAMLETRLDNMMSDYARRMQAQGIAFDQYLKYTGMTKEQFREQMRDQAVLGIKTRLVLEEVAKQENIKVADEAVDHEIEGMAKQYKMEFDQLKDMLSDEEKEAMRKDLMCQEAIDFLVAEAELIDSKKKAKAEKADEAEEEKE